MILTLEMLGCWGLPVLLRSGVLLLLLLGAVRGAGIGLDGGYTDILVEVREEACAPRGCLHVLRRLKVTELQDRIVRWAERQYCQMD